MAITVPTTEAEATKLEAALTADAVLRGVSEACAEGVAHYIVHGYVPGSFLTAVLSNDLMEAFARADLTSRATLWNLCGFLYNIAPTGCWGSKEKVLEWRGHRGLMGLEDR